MKQAEEAHLVALKPLLLLGQQENNSRKIGDFMKFVHGPDLSREMEALVATQDDLKIAIAYWGSDALNLLKLDPKKPNLKVLCCLKGGKSDPDVIRQFGKRVLQNDRLHAKVIWTPTRAIVGSANASSNGLPSEENVARSLIEAGLVLESSQELANIMRWFDDLYGKAKRITVSDLIEAQKIRDEEKEKSGTGSPRSCPELVDIPLQDLKKSKVAVFLWAIDATDDEHGQVADTNDSFLQLENSSWYLDTPKHAGDYPYDYYAITFEVSEDRKRVLRRGSFQYFPPQRKWRKIKSHGFRVIWALDVEPTVPGLPRFRLGPKSIKVIKERLQGKKLQLKHDHPGRKPGIGLISWEPLYDLLSK